MHWSFRSLPHVLFMPSTLADIADLQNDALNLVDLQLPPIAPIAQLIL
jgi:hypothetical protein